MVLTDDLINSCEGLVHSIIKKYNGYYDLKDLYQVGMIGLINACRNYDDKFNTKFSTYAFPYIVGEVNKFIREDRNIKISKDIIALNKQIDRAKELLSHKLMREATTFEISCYLEIPPEKIIEVKAAVLHIKSLDYSLTDDGKEMNLYDSVKVEEKSYDASIMDLREELKKLDDNDRKLIVERYINEQTQQETAESLGMSQVQVSRSEQKILSKLKKGLS